MISDLILFCTLIVNAGAILNFKLKWRKPEGFEDGEGKMMLGDQVRQFLQNLRYFRIFIGLWNIFVIFCMFIFFGS